MSSTSRRIVVGYDGSPLADQALRWAVEAAAPGQDPVEVLVASALPTAAETWTLPDQAHLEGMQVIAERAEKQVAALGCTEAHVDLRAGEPTTVLLRAAEGAAMLVVGATGHGIVASTVLGSVSRHLAVHAPCPLVVVRPGTATDHTHSRIVVGLDGRWSCRRALDFALERAERTGAHVTAVHAVRPADFGSAEPPAGEDLTRVPRLVSAAVEEARLAHPRADLSLATASGRADQALVAASAQADLVVLGARGRNPFARLLLGSVGQQVLHHAHCSVAIVR